MRALARLITAIVVVGLAACAGVATTTPGRVAVEDQVTRIESLPVPLGVGGSDLAPGVRYAGGLVLRGPALHGLSDIKVEPAPSNPVSVWTVSDFGTLVRFSVVLDGDGRMVEAERAVVRPLRGPDGRALGDKSQADAEGLALMPDGRFLVSFEGADRIIADRLTGDDSPQLMAAPTAQFGRNQGMEGLSAVSGGAWLVLGEAGGAWRCGPADCRALASAPIVPEDGFSFTGVDRDPGGGWFVVERRFRPPLGLTVRVRRMSEDGVLAPPLIQLRPPASVDNFEGVAAVATPSGTRLYLLSDDNANPLQKTLLLAFDVEDPRP